ncbi:hypothetical protein DSO57_1018513 [Entomophthora muscae]|uniref:Uncharacterized protein n=1 Tax=Entomophthora muscae TaxID=34485 RepID=A0ACC2T4G7_9FUNG|nr:hypothetical protein DSO57_1018513 [Entomophthora muscae]
MYSFKGRKLDFNQYSVKFICAKPPVAPPLTTPPPPALAALLDEYKDVFSETLDQQPTPQEINHAVQLQGSLPKAHVMKPGIDRGIG